MQNLSDVRFPQKRLDALIQSAASFDRLNLRADALTPKALGFLYEVNPGLAALLASGQDTRYIRDAAEGVSFARSLEHIRPGMLDVLFPQYEGMKFVPQEPGIDPGKEIFTYRGLRKTGRATLVKSYAEDANLAEITGVEASQAIRPFKSAYAYTTQEIRAAMLAGTPIDVKKAMAARDAIALSIDEVIFYGHTEGGLLGLLNQASTTSYTVATGVSGSKLWRRKTADEMVADLHGIVNNVVKATLGIHRPNAMLLPLAAYNLASTRRMGDGSNQTVLSFFLSTNPYIQSVDPSYRLDATNSLLWGGSANTGRMMVYEKNADRLALLLPIEFEQGLPFQRHFVTTTECHARCGGVISYYPGSISYGDGITDATD